MRLRAPVSSAAFAIAERDSGDCAAGGERHTHTRGGGRKTGVRSPKKIAAQHRPGVGRTRLGVECESRCPWHHLTRRSRVTRSGAAQAGLRTSKFGSASSSGAAGTGYPNPSSLGPCANQARPPLRISSPSSPPPPPRRPTAGRTSPEPGHPDAGRAHAPRHDFAQSAESCGGLSGVRLGPRLHKGHPQPGRELSARHLVVELGLATTCAMHLPTAADAQKVRLPRALLGARHEVSPWLRAGGRPSYNWGP